ncbi:pilus assembly protein PilW [Pseudomonas entomophila]|uniref:PilW family protein n=1 Tax=Pseudomonas entomophila TaxID=312306 RepID=UPI0023D8C3FE|nr:pilus assembly protein PilW [Pseudomonas entomophila]MDF0729162.1 pilus assembly protein PilW [Pseudomonas entomophila]
MSRWQAGFGLLEALLALALGLMLLAAAGQLAVAVQQAWHLQGAAARLQDDARLALQRLAQDIRMTGMFGCLAHAAIDFPDPGVARAFATPLQINHGADGRLTSLSLLAAELPGGFGQPDWTLLTDCRSWAQVRPGRHLGSGDTLAFPLRQHLYRVQDGSLMLGSGGLNARLIDNVRGLWITREQAGEGERLDLRLELFEPVLRIEQRHALSVALRNRLPPS